MKFLHGRADILWAVDGFDYDRVWEPKYKILDTQPVHLSQGS